MLFRSSTSAFADWQKTDWLTEGDEQATLHIETGVEWLRLSNTNTLTYAEVETEMEEGGDFYGWRFPTVNEVQEWVLSISTNATLNNNIETEDYRNAINYESVWALEWRDAMGRPYSVSDDRVKSYGVVVDESGSTLLFGNVRVFSNQTQYFYLNWEHENDIALDSGIGVFLVSDGGVTLSSINNPSLNANNANAPINTVPVMAGGLGLLLGGLLLGRRKIAK